MFTVCTVSYAKTKDEQRQIKSNVGMCCGCEVCVRTLTLWSGYSSGSVGYMESCTPDCD